jgi:hypothetical protein
MFDMRTINALVLFEKSPDLLENIFKAYDLLETKSK